jgi:hypothetical protein
MGAWHNPSPPGEYKRWTLVEYALRAGIDTLVETGSCDGDTVEYTRHFFKDVYSIELSDHLYGLCRQRFAECPGVHLFHGDSALLLPCILHGISRPAVFWLDAHWSEGITARGPQDSAIQGELDAVLGWGRDDIVVIIDDVRAFGKAKDYPPIESIRARILGAHPDWAFYVQDDIARAHRPFREKRNE